nr:uncharacterized protein LOC129261582 [Lytechinus pictus]
MMLIKLCFACSILVISFSHIDGATHTEDNVLDFFPSTSGDGLNVVWAHGVNSIAALNESLADDTMMLETDIILRGIGTENQTNIPVHAHPPLTDSDLTLEHFIQVTTQHANKGMKLDFKYLEALEPSMVLIRDYESELKAPLWINADIVIGPNSPRDPVPPQPFIDIANRYFDKTTLSLGFTTAWGPLMADKLYTWTMIFDNLYYSYPLDPQPVTFPIRAVWCKTSWPKFVWLLGLRDSFSITVWSSGSDIVDVGGLVDLRTHGDTRRIFYDLPDLQKEAFLTALDDPARTPSPPLDTAWEREQWMAFENQDGRNFVFLSTEGLGISGNASRAAIVHSKRQHMPGNDEPMAVRTRVQFVDRYDSTSTATVDIFIRSKNLVDDAETRENILAGNTDPSGLKYSISSDGGVAFNGTQFSESLPAAECYNVQILDHLDGSMQVDFIVKTCSDALEDDPNAEKVIMSFPEKEMDDGQEYYVIVMKTGSGKDVILEDLHVKGSQDPEGLYTTPTYTTESRGRSLLEATGLFSLVISAIITIILSTNCMFFLSKKVK